MVNWGLGRFRVLCRPVRREETQWEPGSEAILAQSELKELWEETEEFEQWKATVTDLLERLG